ncbi:MAG: NAD-dependent epimerase/dehydratase family protein [Cucumibacter sp.]
MAGKPIILVTGAGGFIAKRIVLELLGRSYAVRGTLRDTKRSDEVRDAIRPHLKGTGVSLGGDLKFLQADLLSEAGWGRALEGVAAVIHTASPFPTGTPGDPQEVIRPAVEGTIRVLRAAHAAGVKRAVLTSSGSAITFGHQNGPGELHFNERHWSNLEDPRLTPYNRAKTLAELAAWDVANETGIKLAVINPTLVMGPMLDKGYSTSMEVIKRLLGGRVPMIPNIGFGIVDIRDVAEMHVNALANPAAPGKRHFAHAGYLMLADIAAILRELYPKAPIPTRKAPDFLLRFFARFDSSLKQVVDDLGIVRVIDASSGRALLGHDFIPAREAIQQTAEGLMAHGIVKRR